MVTWAYKMDVVATWLAFGLAPKKWGQTHTHTQGHGLAAAVPVPARWREGTVG